MKIIRVLSLCTLVLLLVVVAPAADKATWTGTLVDAYCYLQDNSNVGNDHSGVSKCGTECLKNGRPAGLLTDDKKFYSLVAPSPALAKYVGQPIRVTGDLFGSAIVASKVEVKQGAKWVPVDINIKGMM
jgi:hypothetical protein